MNPFYGDVVLYKGNGIESKILEPFTGEWTHSALRLNHGSAQSLDFWGILKHDLIQPKNSYDEYLILRHKEINQRKQKAISRINRVCSSNYDLKLILNIGIRKLKGYIPNKVDLYNKGHSTCSSRIAHMYYIVELEIDKDIHFSQIEPHHFLESRKFDIVGEWKK